LSEVVKRLLQKISWLKRKAVMESRNQETERDLQDDSKGLTSVLKILEVHSTFERRRWYLETVYLQICDWHRGIIHVWEIFASFSSKPKIIMKWSLCSRACVAAWIL
jgi:hypothetical protein